MPNAEFEPTRSLIDKQLAPFNLTYADVANDRYWMYRYTTTDRRRQKFITQAVNYLKTLGYSPKQAQIEVDWFMFNYGLSLKRSVGALA